VLSERKDGAGEHRKEGEPDEHKARWRNIPSVAKTSDRADQEHEQEYQYKNISDKDSLGDEHRDGARVKEKQQGDFRACKGFRGKHPWQSCAKKPKDESAKKAKGHDAHMGNPGIEFSNVPEMQRPEQDADDSCQRRLGEKEPKRFLRSDL
jgi:hypothetical protein